MRLRKAGLQVEFPETLPQNGENTADTVYQDSYGEGGLDDMKMKEVLFEKLEMGLGLLKPEQRLCVELFFLKDKSYKDIMRETGLSLNEIKTHLQNGKLNLKKMLSK